MNPLEHLTHREKMMVARDGALSETERQRILQAVASRQAAEDISHAQLARILGCSPATWSQVARGKYTGDVDHFLRRARTWLERREAGSEVPLTEYVRTSIGRMIHTVCRIAVDQPCMGLVITPSGCGKTAALTEYVRGQGRNRAVYFQAGQVLSTQVALLTELAERLDVTPPARATAAMIYRKIRGRLAGFYAGGKGDPMLIVVDEATTLRTSAINILRNLHDEPACRPAIVLADTWRLDAELHSRHGMAGGYEQLRSRCKAVYKRTVADEIPLADVKAVADSVLAGLGCDQRLHRDGYRFLHKLAQGDGKLRNVVHRLHTVHLMAQEMRRQARYDVAQLDYVATLVGATCEMDHGQTIPFQEVA
ncbi:MAG: AAA family ATPase [Planctomycetota bacterium]|jgi:DNA transposition AAA+ family ATPase